MKVFTIAKELTTYIPAKSPYIALATAIVVKVRQKGVKRTANPAIVTQTLLTRRGDNLGMNTTSNPEITLPIVLHIPGE